MDEEMPHCGLSSGLSTETINRSENTRKITSDVRIANDKSKSIDDLQEGISITEDGDDIEIMQTTSGHGNDEPHQDTPRKLSRCRTNTFDGDSSGILSRLVEKSQ